MPLYRGVAVENASDVDAITRIRIKDNTGDVDEELKWHRLALFSVVVLGDRNKATSQEVARAKHIAGEVREKYLKIETIINEGKQFKKENGYA